MFPSKASYSRPRKKFSRFAGWFGDPIDFDIPANPRCFYRPHEFVSSNTEFPGRKRGHCRGSVGSDPSLNQIEEGNSYEQAHCVDGIRGSLGGVGSRADTRRRGAPGAGTTADGTSGQPTKWRHDVHRRLRTARGVVSGNQLQVGQAGDDRRDTDLSGSLRLRSDQGSVIRAGRSDCGRWRKRLYEQALRRRRWQS